MSARAAEWKARRAARAALDKRAGDLVVLDVQRLSGVTDYFLICSGKSTTHLETITEAIRADLRGEGAVSYTHLTLPTIYSV